MRITLLFCTIALLGLTSCIGISTEVFAEPRTVTESVELGEVENVTAEIEMPAGGLRVSGGAAKLMEGEFVFNVPALEPTVRYEATGFRGRLKVEGQKGKTPANINDQNRWDVRLNDEIPLDLKVNMGAGENNLDLRGLTLRSVDVDMGVGECDMNLVGEWDRNFSVDVNGGIGEFTVRVPSGIGVVAHAKGGIGEVNARGFRKEDGRYVTEAYGDTPVTITLDIKGGIGEINLIAVD